MKTGYQKMHEDTGEEGEITEAERILLEAHRNIRRAERDTRFAVELDTWNELRQNVWLLQNGRDVSTTSHGFAEGMAIARLIARYIDQSYEESYGKQETPPTADATE